MYYEEVLRALNLKKVAYVIVGGIAVNLHGVPRSTADLDLMIALNNQNLRKITSILDDLSYRPRIPTKIEDITIENLAKWRRDKRMLVVSFWNPKRPYEEVDILSQNPIEFEEIKAKSKTVRADGLKIPIASISHLILLKKISNRDQDKADISALEKIRKMREK